MFLFVSTYLNTESCVTPFLVCEIRRGLVIPVPMSSVLVTRAALRKSSSSASDIPDKIPEILLRSVSGTFQTMNDDGLGTADDTQVTGSATIGGSTGLPDKIVSFRHRRNGSNGGDTFTGTAQHLGLSIEYTAKELS